MKGREREESRRENAWTHTQRENPEKEKERRVLKRDHTSGWVKDLGLATSKTHQASSMASRPTSKAKCQCSGSAISANKKRVIVRQTKEGKRWKHSL